MRVVCGVFAALLTFAAAQAQALTITVRDNLSGMVTVTARGSLDLTGLGAPVARDFDFYLDPIVDGARGWLAAGLPEQVKGDLYRAEAYAGAFFNPRASFGSGPPAPHWSAASSPAFIGLDGGRNELLLTPGYRSGDPIFTRTWYVGAPGFSLATLGLDPGFFRYDLVNGERIHVAIGAAGAVPLPAGLPLVLTGLALLGALRSRRLIVKRVQMDRLSDGGLNR